MGTGWDGTDGVRRAGAGTRWDGLDRVGWGGTIGDGGANIFRLSQHRLRRAVDRETHSVTGKYRQSITRAAGPG